MKILDQTMCFPLYTSKFTLGARGDSRTRDQVSYIRICRNPLQKCQGALRWCYTRGGGTLPSNRLMGMFRWMGSYFHDWIDYNGVAFSIELLEWGRIFSGFGGKNIQASREFLF